MKPRSQSESDNHANHENEEEKRPERLKRLVSRVHSDRKVRLTRIRRVRVHVHVHFRLRGEIEFVAGHSRVGSLGGGMPSPDAHYTLELINHETGDRLKIELIDLPFPGARSYDSHLPLLTLRASSMSHRLIRLLPRRLTLSGLPIHVARFPAAPFPRAPFAFASMASGPARFPWRARQW
jgi:hypothetical protein